MVSVSHQLIVLTEVCRWEGAAVGRAYIDMLRGQRIFASLWSASAKLRVRNYPSADTFQLEDCLLLVFWLMVAICYLLLDSSNSTGKLDLGYFFVELHTNFMQTQRILYNFMSY